MSHNNESHGVKTGTVEEECVISFCSRKNFPNDTTGLTVYFIKEASVEVLMAESECSICDKRVDGFYAVESYERHGKSPLIYEVRVSPGVKYIQFPERKDSILSSWKLAIIAGIDIVTARQIMEFEYSNISEIDDEFGQLAYTAKAMHVYLNKISQSQLDDIKANLSPNETLQERIEANALADRTLFIQEKAAS